MRPLGAGAVVNGSERLNRWERVGYAAAYPFGWVLGAIAVAVLWLAHHRGRREVVALGAIAGTAIGAALAGNPGAGVGLLVGGIVGWAA